MRWFLKPREIRKGHQTNVFGGLGHWPLSGDTGRLVLKLFSPFLFSPYYLTPPSPPPLYLCISLLLLFLLSSPFPPLFFSQPKSCRPYSCARRLYNIKTLLLVSQTVRPLSTAHYLIRPCSFITQALSLLSSHSHRLLPFNIPTAPRVFFFLLIRDSTRRILLFT